MRGFLVLCALVAAPFAVSVSQDRSGSAPREHDAVEQCDNEHGDADDDRSNDVRTLTGQQDGEEADEAEEGEEQCAPPPPPPPGVTVDGRVFDVATGLGLSGWSVDLSGSVSATALTDGNGNYSFTVPAGTYTVCEGMPLPGWTNTFPPNGPTCPFGLGYGPFILTAGQSASLNNFGNTHP